MTIAGAGGAATAICIQAALDGVKEISIFNKKDEFFIRAEQTARDITNKTNCKVQIFDIDDAAKLREEIATSSIFTNATSVGMKPLEGLSVIQDPSMLHQDLIVSDVVYIPKKSRLLEMAEEQGCRTINGLGMMLWQGARAFEIWTGEEMPVKAIKELLF